MDLSGSGADDTKRSSTVPVQDVPMTEEEKAENQKKFEDIIYANLEKILEKRPGYPVRKFA